MDKKINCSECKREVKDYDFFMIDDLPVCYKCLFDQAEPLAIYPIGKVSRVNSDGISTIDLFPYQEKFMYKLEEEKRISIIYYLHQTHYIKTIFRRGRKVNGKEVGVFASRTPHRTSRIAVSTVELVKIIDTHIYVKGLDAFEGSPILDIKAIKKEK